MEPENLLTTAEAAVLLGISRNSFSELKQDGFVTPCGTRGNGQLYQRVEIEALSASRAQTGRYRPKPHSEDSALLTSAEAAVILGVSWRTLDRLRAAGAVTSTGRNRSFRYTRESVEALHQRRLRGEPDFARAELCACDCGGTLATGGRSRYLPGHHMRQNDQMSIRGAAVKRRYPKPPTILGQFLRDKWQASGLPLRTYAESFVGIGHSQFRSYIKGVRPQDRVLVRLRAFYPDLPEVESYSDTLRDRAKKNLRDGAYQATRTREALDKMAASQRGRVVPQEVIDKAQETRKTSEAWAEHMKKTADLNRSVKNRATRSLTLRFKREPTPSKDTLSAWADDAAAILGITSSAVMGVWRPTLVRKKLVPPGGRPKNTQRCEALQTLIRATNWDGIGTAPYGFDVRLGDSLDLAYSTAHRWRIRHMVDCASCVAEIRENSTRTKPAAGSAGN